MRPELVDGVLRRCLGRPAGPAEWDAAIGRLDAHGLVPLANARLAQLGELPPAAAGRSLAGLALVQRGRSARQRRALAELLAALADRGIVPLVLKGAALGALVYGDPELRPMGDLDLLVRCDEGAAAAAALVGLGFEARPATGRRREKHVPFVREGGGTVVVELHDALFPIGHRAARDGAWFAADPRPFEVDGVPALALRPEAALRHLCHHLVGHADVFTRVRLIWLLDVLLLDSAHGLSVDADPLVPAVLSLAREAAAGAGPLDFDGWPRHGLAAQRRAGKSLGGIARDTLAPPDWWLRLHHGLAADRRLGRYRWVEHPREIARLLAGHLGERLQGGPGGFAPRPARAPHALAPALR